MSEVSLQHGMTRQMVAGQSMQTGMQILQASSLELKQLIRQALETNPLLRMCRTLPRRRLRMSRPETLTT